MLTSYWTQLPSVQYAQSLSLMLAVKCNRAHIVHAHVISTEPSSNVWARPSTNWPPAATSLQQQGQEVHSWHVYVSVSPGTNDIHCLTGRLLFFFFGREKSTVVRKAETARTSSSAGSPGSARGTSEIWQRQAHLRVSEWVRGVWTNIMWATLGRIHTVTTLSFFDFGFFSPISSCSRSPAVGQTKCTQTLYPAHTYMPFPPWDRQMNCWRHIVQLALAYWQDMS